MTGNGQCEVEQCGKGERHLGYERGGGKVSLHDDDVEPERGGAGKGENVEG